MKKPDHLSIKEIREINRKLEGLLKKYQQYRLLEPQFILLDHADFLQLFKISRRTSLSWREQKIIPYYVVVGKIYFRLSDIQELLDKHKVQFKPQQDVTQ
ncbi:helix-turn-helix domain-containing protein [Salegentibacter sp. HM20]